MVRPRLAKRRRFEGILTPFSFVSKVNDSSGSAGVAVRHHQSAGGVLGSERGLGSQVTKKKHVKNRYGKGNPTV